MPRVLSELPNVFFAVVSEQGEDFFSSRCRRLLCGTYRLVLIDHDSESHRMRVSSIFSSVREQGCLSTRYKDHLFRIFQWNQIG